MHEDSLEAVCSCGASLKLKTNYSLEKIVKAMLIWQRLHDGCRHQAAMQPTIEVMAIPQRIADRR
jgi:hypothetical protein